MVLKGGSIVAAPMGDPNASIPTPQPVHYRPMFGAFGKRAAPQSSVVFVSKAALRGRACATSSASRSSSSRSRTRAAASRKKSMIHNDATPQDRGRSRNLRGARRRRTADLRAGRGAADGAAVFSVLRPCDASAPSDDQAAGAVERRDAPIDRVVLDADERHRRRIVLTGERGTRVPARSAAGRSRCATATGWCSTTARSCAVAGKPEPLVEIAADDAAATWRGSPGTSATATPTCRSSATGCASAAIMCSRTCCAGSARTLTPIEAPFDPEPRRLCARASMARPWPSSDAITRAMPARRAPSALYRLMAWLSPAYPVGAFSYSSGHRMGGRGRRHHGRGSAASAGSRSMIGEGGGFCDAVFFAHAHRAVAADDDAALRAVAELAAAFAPSKERHLETTAQGRAFLEATRAAWPCAALDRLADVWDGADRLSGRGRRRRAPATASPLEPALARLSCRRSPPTSSRPACGSSRSARPTASACSPRSSRSIAATAARALACAARRRRRRGLPRRPRQHAARDAVHAAVPELMTHAKPAIGPLRVGIGGPVGSGKTALMDALCKRLRDRYEIAAITNDIYTKGDAEYPGALRRARARAHRRRRDRRLPAHRDPRGRLDQPRRGRRDAREISRPRPDPDRIRRRQSRRDLLARARRSHDLRHRRRGRRQDPVARAAPASPAPICWSSTRSTSRRMSAPRSR